MGVRTALLALTPSAGSVTQAETIGTDVAGALSLLELKCQEMIQLMKFLKADVFTPASDSTNATAMDTQVTALS